MTTAQPLEHAIYSPPAWQVDPAQCKRIGVVSGDTLYVYGHVDPRDTRKEWQERPQCEWQWRPGDTLADLARVALKMHCGAVWLLDSLPWGPMAHEAMRDTSLAWHELSGARGTALVGLVAQRKTDAGKQYGMPLGIYAPWVADHWAVASKLAQLPADPERRACVFAEGVMLAAFALGAQLRFSPSYTGLQILRQTLGEKQRRGMEIPQLSEWARELVCAHLPTPVQWARPIEAGADYDPAADVPLLIRKYDRIASYVASAREVPVGDPWSVREFHPNCPGLYHITARAPQSWPRGCPGMFHTGEGAGEYPAPTDYAMEVWAWEPQIRLALSCGWHVDVIEGWYWPKGKEHRQVHDLFRPWQDRVWGARRAAEAYDGDPIAASIAKAIAKRCGVATVGRLLQRKGRARMSRAEAREAGARVLMREMQGGKLSGMVAAETDLGRADLRWPHAWATIIAGANERLQSSVFDTAAKYGECSTIAMYVDARYDLAPHADLADSEQLGKFRLERLSLLPAARVADFNDMARQSAQSWAKAAAHLETAGAASEPETDEGEWDEDEEGAGDAR